MRNLESRDDEVPEVLKRITEVREKMQGRPQQHPQARGVLWAKPGKSTRERDHTVRQNS